MPNWLPSLPLHIPISYVFYVMTVCLSVILKHISYYQKERANNIKTIVDVTPLLQNVVFIIFSSDINFVDRFLSFIVHYNSMLCRECYCHVLCR